MGDLFHESTGKIVLFYRKPERVKRIYIEMCNVRFTPITLHRLPRRLLCVPLTIDFGLG